MSWRCRGGVLIVLLLAGCSGLTQRKVPEPDVYVLTPPSRPTAAARHGDVLLVARPRARAGLEADRLAVRLADGRLDTYAGARWAAPLPQMAEGLLIDALQAAGVERAVVSERSPFHGRYVLQTEIVSFTAEYAGDSAPPTVRVSLRAELGTPGNRAWLAEVSAVGTARATADRRHDVVAAYQSAWDAAAQELASELSRTIDRLETP